MKIVRFMLLILAWLGIADTILIYVFTGGMDIGILLPGFAGAFILLAFLFTRSNLYHKKSRFFNRIAKVTLCLFLVWLISFGVLVTAFINAAVSQTDEDVQCVFVLGAGIKGETPTLVLQERLNFAIDYMNNHPSSIAIVSGGKGFGESITEAEAMNRYMVDRGIGQNRILKEEKATSTYENMLFSKKVFEDNRAELLSKVMIITSDFHMLRSKMLAERVGLQAAGISASTPWYIYPNVLLREYLAYFKSLFLDK